MLIQFFLHYEPHHDLCLVTVFSHLQAEKYNVNEENSVTQEAVKRNIDVDLISLHDYSKSKQDVNDSLPTLLNHFNKFVEEYEIVYVKPQEITIFQVGTYNFLLKNLFLQHKF